MLTTGVIGVSALPSCSAGAATSTPSRVSAGSILRNLDSRRFDVIAVGITPAGSWVLTDANPDALTITNRELPQVKSGSGTELALPADPRRGGQLVSLPPGAGEVLESVDVVFPVLHGPYGEDGTIQGLLELAGVPYVGAGVLASAVGMDKEFTKKLLAADGLPVGAYAVLRPPRSTLHRQECERLGLPVFVKPARGGSSIGVSRVSSWDQLPAAVARARRHDPKVIVEAAISGRELECGVLEMPDGTLEASTLGRSAAGVRGREDSSTTSQPSISTTQPNWTCPPRSMTRSQRRFVSWRSGRSRLSTAGVWPGWTSSSPTTVR